MFGQPTKSTARRAEIRKNRPDLHGRVWQLAHDEGILTSLALAFAFFIIASAIVMTRQRVVPYRPGQWVSHAIVSRVDFTHTDRNKLLEAKAKARAQRPQIYRPTETDVWAKVEERLLSLPDAVSTTAGDGLDGLDPVLRQTLDSGAITTLKRYATPEFRDGYDESVRAYIQALRDANLVILPQAQRAADLEDQIEVRWREPNREANPFRPGKMTAALPFDTAHRARLQAVARTNFVLELQPKIVALTEAALEPTHELDREATAKAKNRAADQVDPKEGEERKPANMVLVERGRIEDSHWQLLRAENEAFIASLDGKNLKSRAGLAGLVLIITVVLACYVAMYQPKVVRNHGRGVAIAGLLLSTQLLAQVAGIGPNSLYLFGIGPTILVAMILAIAYDRRFAMGIGSMHAILVTLGLGQGIEFFMILWVGILTCCFLLDDIRTRSKLVEVGGLIALAMMVATAAAGFVSLDPVEFVFRNCLYTGAAGIIVGFIVLGILPFIERSFRITTSMTLLELADASQPLLRRLALEAPGTYNHSLQVANLAEEAAEAIHANSLLCRVGSYYHDVGKINKAEYFIENQGDGLNRHLNLSPSVSLLIIIGHVKDGIELAREYNLPTSLFPFIQQHHGTTLVEFFYHQACTKKDQGGPNEPAISETQYRYPGPKPRSREVAVVMLADATESACRAMSEPTASRIESLVHDLAMKRFLDGQFDECDLTMRDLELIERSLVKTILGIYHGRIAYPSTAQTTQTTAPAPVAARSA